MPYKFHEARTGDMVPVWTDNSGKDYPLHSMMDPLKEANRLIDTVQNEGFLVFLGLGAGFLPKAALERDDIGIVLVIEYNANALNELLTHLDYSRLLNDPRFILLTDPSTEHLEEQIVTLYQPVLHGGIRVIPLRSRTAHDTEQFTQAADTITKAIEMVSADYSVQAHFGKRWYSNILNNVKNSYSLKQNLPSVQRIAVCGAGPSLSVQLDSLKTKRDEFFLIASDTSLPCLLNNKIIPDAVISIDAQCISYLHFMNGLPEETLLFLDLLSPPLHASLSKKHVFFSGGHPLTRLISVNDKSLFELDTSGGNVTFAAISLAEYLGAEEIELYGADYSYPNGFSYAKGTYIYSSHESRQNRFFPLETQISTLLYRTPLEKKFHPDGSWYYETATLKFYREKLEEKNMKAKLIPVEGMGAKIVSHSGTAQKRTQRKKAENTNFDAELFLNRYRTGLEKLGNPGKNASEYLASLDDDGRNVLTTILPVAAALKKRNPDWGFQELLTVTRDYCLSKITPTKLPHNPQKRTETPPL